MSTTEKELRDAARAAEAFLSDEERRERDAQGEALDRAIAQHEKARGDLEASIRRDAYARGLEEAAEMAERRRDEAQAIGVPLGDECWIGRQNEAANIAIHVRARAEAVRKGRDQ